MIKSINWAQSLRINQVNERQVQLGDQFILSCVAVGSSDLKFAWYKDDMAVNMSKATRYIAISLLYTCIILQV